jgi:hypothetical protein
MELTLPKVIFMIAFTLIMILAVLLLNPFKLHRKRPVSTFLFKFTYLIYLLSALSITFLFMFNYGMAGTFFEDIDNPNASIYFTVLLVTLVVPSVGILLRRSVKRRDIYNVIFTIFNLSCMLYYLLLVKIAFKIAL